MLWNTEQAMGSDCLLVFGRFVRLMWLHVAKRCPSSLLYCCDIVLLLSVARHGLRFCLENSRLLVLLSVMGFCCLCFLNFITGMRFETISQKISQLG